MPGGSVFAPVELHLGGTGSPTQAFSCAFFSSRTFREQLPVTEGAVQFSGFRTKMPTLVQAVGQGATVRVGSKESRSPEVHINSGISFLFLFLLGWLFVLSLVL